VREKKAYIRILLRSAKTDFSIVRQTVAGGWLLGYCLQVLPSRTGRASGEAVSRNDAKGTAKVAKKTRMKRKEMCFMRPTRSSSW
jgi:hypothetical protein